MKPYIARAIPATKPSLCKTICSIGLDLIGVGFSRRIRQSDAAVGLKEVLTSSKMKLLAGSVQSHAVIWLGVR